VYGPPKLNLLEFAREFTGLLIDTHAHLNAPEFESDLSDVLSRAANAGVHTIICVGYDLPTSRRALELAEEYPFIFATVGMHPNSVDEAPRDWQSQLERMVQHPKVVAVGESGLDYYREFTDPSAQRAALQWHLELADQVGLPIVVHNRDSDADVTEALVGWAHQRRSKGVPGLLHSFAGSVEMRDAALEAGFAVSFSGMVTFSNRNIQHVAESARSVPDDRLLVETDCPYLAPAPHRGHRNEPAFVRDTAARVAELRGTTLEAIAQATTANARRVFPGIGAVDE
jgi:TatD DNase family protein